LHVRRVRRVSRKGGGSPAAALIKGPRRKARLVDDLGPAAPTLPNGVLIPVAVVSGLIILFVIMRAKSRQGGFVIGAAWLRYVLSAFTTFANRPIVAGLSGNALASAATFAVGALCVNPRNFMLRFLVPFYLLMALAVLSAAVNQSIDGLILVLVKYGYLIVVTLGVYEALRRHPDGRVLRLMLWTFFAPLVLQAFSVVLGVAKQTENDNSISYIGGYHHEATFSVMLAGCVVIAALTTHLNKYIKTGLILGCVVGIYLANYRTTILAMAPLLIVYFGFSSVQGFVKKDRPLVVSAVIILCSIVLGLISLFLASRFSDIGVAVSGHVNLIKPPSEYSVDESRILSGRPMIWMSYIYAWLDGTPLQHVFGFGPESWSRYFNLYAHNTLVNYLYEYGVVGVVAMLYTWFSMLASALRVRHPYKGRLVAAHFSFLLLNMGTMPLWMIEGNLIYGVICGFTLYCLSAPQETAPRPPARTRKAPRGYRRPQVQRPPAPVGADASLRGARPAGPPADAPDSPRSNT
jgi:O-Antigen ligase